MRILVVQLGDIGDLVLSTPALSALRAAHPSAHITVLTPPHAAPVLTGSGLTDAVITFGRFPGVRQFPALIGLARQLRAGRYDVIVFFHHFTTRAGALKFAALAHAAGSPRRIGLANGRAGFLTETIPDSGFGAQHQADYWLQLVALLGADSTPCPPIVGVSAADRAWAAQHLPDGARYVIIHAGSGGDSFARRWDPAAFAEVGNALAADGARIVLVGGRGDDSAAVRQHLTMPPIDLTGLTTLNQLAAAIDRAALFIGADSGVLHVASSTRTPLVTLYGPSNAAAWGPYRPPGTAPAVIVRSAPECQPCSYIGHGLGQRAGCAPRTCMRLITPPQVTAIARRVLAGDAVTVPTPPPPGRAAPTIPILGLPVSRVTFADWLTLIDGWVTAHRAGTLPRLHHVCTLNPEMVMIARRDPIFRAIVERAALTVPDGVGLLWAARRQGTPLTERVTGSDGLPLIAARAAETGWRLFLLGAAPGVADQTADALRTRYPGVQIVGTYAGSPAADEEADLVERINAAAPDLLFVAYGAPEQDKWIARNTPRLRVAMAIGVGGAFDFVAGIVPRAPAWMRRAGVEWLYRLYLQPRRIGRMLRLPRFVLAVLRERVTRKADAA